jgi:uncharacterized protein YggE
VKPDRARIYLNVETTAPTVKEARSQNSSQVNKVMAAIQGLGLADLKMKSTNVSMTPVHSQDEKKEKLPQLLGYHITHTFTVLVRDDDPAKLAAAASRVLDAGLENGVNSVDQVAFFKEDLAPTRREALRMATEVALANAKAIAAGAQEILGEATSISGSPDYQARFDRNSNGITLPGAFAGDAGTLVAGEVEISCRISVTCILADAKK